VVAMIPCATPRCRHRFAESDFVPSRSQLVLFARCPDCRRSTPRSLEIAHARNTDPATSHAAARSVTLTPGRELVLSALRTFGPMTDEQLVPILAGKLSPSGTRTRRSELVSLGLVRATSKTRPLASGRDGIVWEAVPE
jgi:hypothetical protein